MRFLNNMMESSGEKKKIRLFDNRKNILIAVVAAVTVLAVLMAVAYNLTRGIKVEAIEIQPEDIASKISATGTVNSGAEKGYYVFTPARVTALNVKVGDYVNAGDVLAVFESSDIDVNVAQLKYQWETAEAAFAKGTNAINLLKPTIAGLDREISTLNKSLGKAAVSVGNASLIAEFLTETGGEETSADILKELDGITGVDNETKLLFSQLGDDTENQVSKALSGTYGNEDDDIKNAVISALNNAEKKLETAMADSNDKLRKQLQVLLLKQQKNILNAQVPSTNELRHLQAAAAAAKQAYEAVESQAGDLKDGWIAEFPGVVTQVNVNQGGVASTNIAGIVVVDPNALVVDVDLGRYDAEKVKPGQSVTVYVKGAKLGGTVTFISPVADKQGEETSLSCRITLNNPDDRLIMGFDVDVDIQTAEARSTIVLPISAVLTDELGRFCYKYNPDDHTVTKTYIGLGVSNENGYQVIAGLNFGDIVVLNPSDKLYDGVRVRVCEPEETTAKQSGLPTALYTVPETTVAAGSYSESLGDEGFDNEMTGETNFDESGNASETSDGQQIQAFS